MTSLLGKYDVIGFITIVDVNAAREFYRDKLGLRLASEEPPFALVFEANGIMLRLVIAKSLPVVQGTVFGWNVTSASETVSGLEQAGIQLQRFPGMGQDAQGIWTAPTGAKIAWFKDPDGNMLSISEHPEWQR